jgi:hypothetical protein
VARIYAGILGPLALLISLARGAIHAWDAETTVLYAWISLWGFAALGAVLGWLAGRIVDEEVRTRISAERTPPEAASPTAAA